MRTWMGKPVAWAALLGTWATVAGVAAAAGPYDGTRPFVCAVTSIMECAASGQCERQVPDGVNSPRVIRVDVQAQTVSSEVNKRSTLKSVSHVDGELILQGGENGRGWSATIDEATGRMAAAVVDIDYTFSLFGACVLP